MTAAPDGSPPDAAATDRIRALEAELGTLRANAARAQRELYEIMARDLAGAVEQHETLRRIHAEVTAELARARRLQRQQRVQVRALRAELASARQQSGSTSSTARLPQPVARLVSAARRLARHVPVRRPDRDAERSGSELDSPRHEGS